MSAIALPFGCIVIGAILNWRGLPQPVLKAFDWVMNIALVCLMLVIGLNIGTSEEVMNNLGRIGINAALISLTAVIISVIFVLILEKTVLPLDGNNFDTAGDGNISVSTENGGGLSPLLIIMPGCIALGIVIARFVFTGISDTFIGNALDISLVLLYVSVGVLLASNKSVFGYVKQIGFRILLIPVAVFAGCFIGGWLAGLVLGVPLHISIVSATGMGYYSMTGAYLTETVGIEAGVYGFIVNVLRDVITVLLIPILSRISKGAPIASGAGGCMDTMLVPVTKAVGIEYSMIAFLVGTIVTLAVPAWLPVSTLIFG